MENPLTHIVSEMLAFLQRVEAKMSALDNLTAAVTALKTEVDKLAMMQVPTPATPATPDNSDALLVLTDSLNQAAKDIATATTKLSGKAPVPVMAPPAPPMGGPPMPMAQHPVMPPMGAGPTPTPIVPHP